MPKTRAWDYVANRRSDELRRHADVYVFAVLTHRDQSSIDPLDVSQWDFYALPTTHLDNRKWGQASIGLNALRALAGEAVVYRDLRQAVREAAAFQSASVEQANRPSATG